MIKNMYTIISFLVLKEDTDLIPTIVEELQESLQKIESTR